MKILILYQFDAHPWVKTLCINLNKAGFEADSFNIVSWKFFSINGNKIPFRIRLMAPIMYIPKVRGLIMKLYRHQIIFDLGKEYTIIDIHFFSNLYDDLINEFKNRGKKIKITIWGSDFYRVNYQRREEQRLIYNKVDIIQVESNQVQKEFLKIFPECKSKIRIANFGANFFEVIYNLMKIGNPENFKKELGILSKGKIIISCGYSGIKAHQHLIILDSLNVLPKKIKDQLFILVPMTYGGDKKYIKQIKEKLSKLNMPFKIISTSLSSEDICKIRILTDIIVTIQTSDALSSAVQEHLYAGGILVAGDWLPYDVFLERHIFFIKTGLETLDKAISDTVDHLAEIKKMCRDNTAKMWVMSSWHAAIKTWISIYKELESY